MARRPPRLTVVKATKGGGQKPAPGTGSEAEGGEGKSWELPPECPVVPLGRNGRVNFYLDAGRQLRQLEDSAHTRLGLVGLFGRARWFLEKQWPRVDSNGKKLHGWRHFDAAEDLIAACSEAGIWESTERERGRGAWRTEAGELVLHAGGRVRVFGKSSKPWRDHESHVPGLVGRFLYAAAAPSLEPWAKEVPGGADGPAGELLGLLKTWNWRREIDPVLFLGWVGAAMIGGALDWRPMIWLTGSKGTGKSTLQELLKRLFGGGIVQTADSTPAGLWQMLGHQTLPVAFDELEAEEDNRRPGALVKLARMSSSGGMILRGGADHMGKEFVARSAFAFSSILVPPLQPQDRSRISVLGLGELAIGSKAPVLDAKYLADMGEQLLRRMVDAWGRFDVVLAHYHDALTGIGHTHRAADQLAALLTCAHVLLHDGAPVAELSVPWIEQLSAGDLADNDDDTRDEERCLTHLLSSQIDARREGMRTVAELVRIIVGADEGDPDEARRLLKNYGVVITRATQEAPAYVVVANYHQGLTRLFQGSHWAGRSGTMGVWVQALRRLPGAVAHRAAVYFGAEIGRGTALPLELVVPDEAPRQMELPAGEGEG